MDGSLPRIPKLVAVVAAIAIAVDLLFVSTLLAASIVEFGFGIMIAGPILLPLCLFFAVYQYRGTFRRSAGAAKVASTMLYAFAAFLLFAAAVTAAESVRDRILLRLMFFLLPLLIIALICAVAATINLRWSRKLRAAIAEGAKIPDQRGFTLRELLLAVGIIAAVTGVTSQLVRSAPPRFAEGVDASAAKLHLPAGASNVSYRRGVRGTVTYEFTTDEQSFRQWVESGIGSIEAEAAEIPLRDITTPFSIRRYAGDDMTIRSGLYYTWSKEDRGVHAGFDRTTGRGYYDAHYH